MTDLPRPTITFCGHATLLFTFADGRKVILDPWLAGNPACPEALKSFDRLDGMLITHGHDDHMADAAALGRAHKPQHVLATIELCSVLERQGVGNTRPMNLGGTQDVFGMQVTMVRADHTAGAPDGSGGFMQGGVATGFVIRMPDGFTLYFAGDTDVFLDMQLIGELYKPDVAFLPIGDIFTMGPRAAAYACRLLGAPKVVPIHYGTFPVLTGTPEQFRREVEALDLTIEIVDLQPGDRYPG
ncbi:MAG: metal-dependent hydrolase [Acidobacteriota bacterium]